LRERLAVERVGEERFTRHGSVARQAPAELLLHLENLSPEVHFFFGVVRAEEDELARLRLDARAIEHRAQRYAVPAAVARQSLKRATVAGAFESGDELRPANLAEIVERQGRR